MTTVEAVRGFKTLDVYVRFMMGQPSGGRVPSSDEAKRILDGLREYVAHIEERRIDLRARIQRHAENEQRQERRIADLSREASSYLNDCPVCEKDVSRVGAKQQLSHVATCYMENKLKLRKFE